MLAFVQLSALSDSQVESISVSVKSLVAFAGSSGATEPAAPTRRQILDRLAAAPVGFVENIGQAHRPVRYVAQGPGYSFAFHRDGVRVSLVKQSGSQRSGRGRAAAPLNVMLRFVSATPDGAIKALGRPTGRVDYLVGDRSRWRTGLAAYPELVYRNLWAGIDLAFTGSGGTLKYEFRLRPGADPRRIRLAYAGADSLSVSSSGALLVQTKQGLLKDAAPVSYQRLGGRRVAVESRFVLAKGGGYGFAVPRYDRSQPLVIDPGLEYSTYLGGSSDDPGFRIAVHGHDAFVTGGTASPDFPVTPDAFQPASGGGQDAFVTRLDTARDGAGGLQYSTYLGGTGQDFGVSIDVKGHDVYVTGVTASPDFPVTADAFQPASGGAQDVFVTRLDTGDEGPAGLEYSTYLGGASNDRGFEIVVEGHEAYVTGLTGSPNFPVTADAFQPVFAGLLDVFVTRLDTEREGIDGLEYSSYVGGSSIDGARGIAVDGRVAYLTGLTSSPNFPVTEDAFQPVKAGPPFGPGSQDAFVTRLDTGSEGVAGLEYSTYLGGAGDDIGFSIKATGDGAYLTGDTTSPNFPVTPNAFQPAFGGFQDAFVTRLDTRRAHAAGLEYSTYLGGNSLDGGRDISVVGHDAYLTGTTASTNFPVTADAFQPVKAGPPFFPPFGFSSQDAFVTRLDTDDDGAAGLEYSTYLGGSNDDIGFGITVVGHDAYLTGPTSSLDFPVTPDAFQPAKAGPPAGPGSQDAFVTRLDTGGGG